MGLKASVYNAKALAPEALAALVRELTPVFGETFGMDEAQVTAYCVKPNAERTHIVAYRASGVCVGYFVMHFFETTAGGRPCTITRGIVGFKRAWRSNAAFGRHVLWFLLRWMVRHPRRPLYGVGLVMHPASYISLTSHLPVSWPRPDVETPPEMVDLLERMADELGMRKTGAPDPLVRSLGVASRSTAAEQAYWREVDHPLARYYLARNPDYPTGTGLLLLAPLGFGQLLRTGGRFLANQARRRRFGWQAALDRYTGGRRIAADDCAPRLSQTQVLAGVPEALCLRLAQEARSLSVRAGQWIFRRGDRGDAFYVLTAGSACVYLDEDSEEVVHQLRPGDVFGEVALVTGAPRSAGVRAAKNCELLRITAASFAALRVAHPDVTARLWRNVARMRFDNFTREDLEAPTPPKASDPGESDRGESDRGTKSATPRTARLARFDAGQDGVVLGAELFLYEGTLGCTLEGQRLRVSAPALLPATIENHLLSPDARLWSLPPEDASS